MKLNLKRALKTMSAALLCAAINFVGGTDLSAGTHIWTGAAGNGLWSTAGNWQGSNKPLFGETDVRVVFPTNGTSSSTVDIPNLVVNEFLVMRGEFNNYSLGGSAGMKITLEARPGFTNVHLASGAITFQSSLELVLSNDCRMLVHGIFECTTVYDPWGSHKECTDIKVGELQFLSKITGPGGMFIDGLGVASIGGSSGNTYDGLTRVASNIKLRLNKTSGNAVGGDLSIDSLFHKGGGTFFEQDYVQRGVVEILDDHQLSNTGSITNRGLILATNRTETIGPLVLINGFITGPGTFFTLNGDVSTLGDTNLILGQEASIYCSTLNLGTISGTRPVRFFNIDEGTELEISASITGTPNINKEGKGDLIFKGINTFDGNISINNGTLGAIDSEWGLGSTNGITRVNANGTLLLRNGFNAPTILLNREHLYLNGGILTGSGNGYECRAPIVLESDSTMGGYGLLVSANVSGPGGLQFSQSGSIFGAGVKFIGSATNTYTGVTVVENAAIDLARTPGSTVIPNSLVVTGSNLSGVVSVLASNQIADSASVFLGNRGELYVSNYEAIASLELQSGAVYGNGALAFTSNLICKPSMFNYSSTFAGRLHLKSGGSHVIYVEDIEGEDVDLEITGIITGDPGIGFTKKGAGTLELAGANTFGGAVVVSEGLVLATSSQAFGVGGGSGVFAYQGGAIHLGNNLSFNNEPLTLAGGQFTVGMGTHNWSGTVNLQTNTTIEISNSFAALNFSGVMSGAANLRKKGLGQMHLTGSGANTFAGTLYIDEGEVWLSKTNVIAIPSNVVIGTATNSATLRLFRSTQIAAGGNVTAEHSASIFDLQSFNQTIGSFVGVGLINMSGGSLVIGGDGIGNGFATGSINGTGTFQKTGNGTFTMSGNSAGFSGNTLVNGGTLVVNGSLANSPVTVASGAKLAGSGAVGYVNGNGMVSPGNSPGKLTTKHFTNSASSTLMIELNGTTAGTTYDQVDVNGAVKLSGSLQVTRGSNTAANSQFTIIKNDSNDAVSGIFIGLAQAAQFTVGGAKFQISYTGGDGNDVVLTQVASATNAQMRGVSKIIGTTMQVSGVGSPGYDYAVQASTNLSTTNWINIGTVTAGGDGSMTFNDFNAMTSHPMRFYRFVVP
jgi:autotransporter-associated beta strand protein